MPQDRLFSILLESFDRGKRPLPIRGSFWASIGLNPFIEKGKLTSEYYLKNETNSDDLPNFGSSGPPSQLARVQRVPALVSYSKSSSLIIKTGQSFFKESSGVWSHVNTCSLTNTKAHLGMLAEPHQGNLHWCSNQAVGMFDGTQWLSSWNSGLADTYHYMLAVRKYVLVSNGRYVAGWSDAGGETWDTSLLDLQPGYKSKRLRMKKAAGVRQVLIQGQYDADRTKDGIFIWDLSATTSLDFIPVPWMYDHFVENNVHYVIHGNKLTLSEVVGTQLRELNSILDTPRIETAAQTDFDVSFLEKFSDLILINVKGVRATAVTGDNFYPGLWAYNIKNNALFYWMPPSTGNLWTVNIEDVHINQEGLVWVASSSSDDAGAKYYVDKLTLVSGGSGIFREMLITPLLKAGSIGSKIWKKVKVAHNKLLTTAKVLFKYRDFSRDLITSQQVLGAVTASTFTLATAVATAEVGDEVTVIGGTGAGQVRHIITKDSTSKIFTIDADWDTNPDTNSWIEIASWKKMSEKSAVVNKEFDGKILDFSQRGIANQIKLIFEHPKDQVIDLEALRISGEYDE